MASQAARSLPGPSPTRPGQAAVGGSLVELEAGDLGQARQVYAALAPLYALEQQWPDGAYKDVLVLRGVLPSARNRGGGEAPDAEDYRALRQIITDLEPWLTWHA